MADKYRSFSELQEKEKEGRDWVRQLEDRGSRVLVMAPHGGWIERHTAELATAIAGDDLSLYTFRGLKKKGNHHLHLTSHNFDEPLALEGASRADWILAIHGERSCQESFIMVGGRGRELARAVEASLAEAGFSILGARRGLEGRNPTNICNRGRTGEGVQLEISEGLRTNLREDPSLETRFVQAVREGLRNWPGAREEETPASPFPRPGIPQEMDIPRVVDWVTGALSRFSNPERRRVTAGYFPTEMEILGVPVPEIRKTARRLHGGARGSDPTLILQLSQALVDAGIHEVRQVGYELLDLRRDARARLKTLALRRLGKGNDNWASVDAFSVTVSGPVWREGQIPDREVLRWTASKDRWWRRTALVSTVPLNLRSRGGKGDAERTLLICRPLVSDPDPMVAKALSWALRSLISTHGGTVEAFLAEHREGLPALVLREVRKKLDTERKNPGRRTASPRGP